MACEKCEALRTAAVGTEIPPAVRRHGGHIKAGARLLTAYDCAIRMQPMRAIFIPRATSLHRQRFTKQAHGLRFKRNGVATAAARVRHKPRLPGLAATGCSQCFGLSLSVCRTLGRWVDSQLLGQLLATRQNFFE